MKDSERHDLEHEMAPLVGISFLIGLASWGLCAIWRTNGSQAWTAKHSILSGLIAFALALLIGRFLLFMSRVETRSR